MKVYQKSDVLLSINLQDETGAALNLTGAALTFAVAKPFGERKIMKTIESGITVINAIEGRIEIEITAFDTDLPSGDYKMELLVTDIDGHRCVADLGTLAILKSLTA